VSASRQKLCGHKKNLELCCGFRWLPTFADLSHMSRTSEIRVIKYLIGVSALGKGDNGWLPLGIVSPPQVGDYLSCELSSSHAIHWQASTELDKRDRSRSSTNDHPSSL